MKNKRSGFLLIAIILAIGVAVIIFNKEGDISKVCFGDFCFVVEIADSDEERRMGLMYRENLDENNGMLFIFEDAGNYPFWMKNTLIPLDIIWIDGSGMVVDIKTAVPCLADPCPSILHDGTAKYVLEINGGKAREFGIAIDEKAQLLI